MSAATLVRDLDEAALLAAFLPALPPGRATLVGPGDDSAVVAAPDGRVVISTDVLVEDHHFRRAWSTGRDVGWRAATQNLADVAAMGAEPTAIVVSLVLPPDLEVAWVVAFAEGLAEVCGPLGVGVVGGDLSAGERIVAAVTVHGDLAGRAPVLRSGARPGDILALAGAIGGSAAGLAVLRARDRPRADAGAPPTEPAEPAEPVELAGLAEAAEPADPAGVLAAYRRPDPPLTAGPAAADAGAHAMIDVSDGLLRDAGRIAAASGVVVDLSGAALEPDRAELADAVRALGHAGGGADALVWVLTGGEDHALLAAFAPGAVLPRPFRPIGRVLAPAPGRTAGTVLLDGAHPPVAGLGWDHFAPG